ncbi:chymotrypsin-1-like [Leptidea sinapis]|uniref:chymotrypsin-1-like n=1 Tax=Leptidea sinapis TaxID=189913 RepID=UPI00213B06BB|nr:chymotrypsin-1-like [Leptidea sinapis]
MYLKVVFFVAICAGALAIPAQDDMSIFFEHTQPDARIVGGTTAGPVPWMVALTNGLLVRQFICGASVVTNRHLLTAAHCISAVFSVGSLSSSLRATVGTNRWNTGGTHYNLERNITHPNYVASVIKNDLGFLVTRTNIVFNNVVEPAVLNYDFANAGVRTRVNGWGRTRAGGSLSAVLLELEATIVDGNFCASEVQRLAQQLNVRGVPPVEPHIEICTFHSLNHGTCNGDSGSALVRAGTNQQVGVVSWGLPCARGAPDMFVRVSAFRAWIESVIR